MSCINEKLVLFLNRNYDIYYIIKKLISEDKSYKYYNIKDDIAYIDAFDIYWFGYSDLNILQNLLQYNMIKYININCTFDIKSYHHTVPDDIVEEITSLFPCNKIILDYSLIF